VNANDTQVMPFQFRSSKVRVVTDEHGESWFVVKDVCTILDIKDPSMACSKIPSEHKGTKPIGTLGGTQQMLTVDEPGLYRLVLRSDKPEAEPFMEWVTSDVLPTIRKTGRYDLYSMPHSGPPPVETTMDKEIKLYEVAARTLRVSDAGKIKMLHTLGQQNGCSTKHLPDYTEEKITKSLTALLKEFQSEISVKTAYPLLVANGLIEIKTRDSMKKDKEGNTKKTIKEFKSLSEHGLKYGKNLLNPHNEKETQPHFYVDTFPELLDMLNGWIQQAA